MDFLKRGEQEASPQELREHSRQTGQTVQRPGRKELSMFKKQKASMATV